MHFYDIDYSKLVDLPQAELMKYFPPPPMEIDEQVYSSINGTLIRECRLPWVKTIFVPGHPPHENYGYMQDAYAHLCERMGDVEEDPDVEVIIDSLLRYAKIIGLEMFKYGRLYEKMQAEEK